MRLTSTVPAVLLAAVGLVGCLDAAAVTCADGTLCPVGWACDPLGCVSPEQQRACGDQLDGAPCTLAGIGAGTCTDGRCVIAVCGNERIEPGERCDDGNNFSGDGCNATCSSDELCGNGLRDDGEACDCGTDEAALPSGCDAANGAAGGTCRLDCILVGCGNGGPDPGEVCDDGNQTSGDGCSYDCASLEVCGNGYPDFAAGEQCDAGPGLSHDGCASACVAEVAAWDAVVPDGRLPPRTQLQLAVDGATGEVIAHGGVDGNARSDTWAWDGAAWRQLQANMPWPNFNSALGYHHGRGELVRFGGAEADDATYFFDGATWRREQLDPSPPVQTGGQLVWDAARAELVLVGGGPAFGPPTQETWALTGSGWTQRSTSAPPRRYTSATYDPSRAQVVMIGGYDDTDACDGTLWGWDGSAWTALPVGGPPPLVAFASLAWAPRDQQLVLFGTRCSDGVAETWVLEHDAWAVVPTTSTPLAGGRLVLDPTRGELLLAGGFDGNFTYSDTTWAWTGTDWRQRDDLNPPAVAGALAYDATRGELVMTLSTCCDAPALEVWRHDGARWHPATPPGDAPGPRGGHGLAYDPIGGRLILFGGRWLGGDVAAETWALTQDGWTSLGIGGPPARADHAMATDPGRGTIVLVGGWSNFAHRDDVWVFDGDAWTEVGGPRPSARRGPGLAYDARRDVMILAGGDSVVGAQADTWAFDGTSWTELVDLAPPFEARYDHALIADPQRGEVVMIDGNFVGDQVVPIRVLDGAGWVPLRPANPRRYDNLSAAYHARAATLLAFGSDQGGLAATGLLRLDAPQPDAVVPEEACTDATLDADGDGLAGCDDPDCWARCQPACAPTRTCDPAAGPRCGDGTCNPALEVETLCPADCADACGDGVCARGYESHAACPSDCGSCGDGACTGDETAASCWADCAP